MRRSDFGVHRSNRLLHIMLRVFMESYYGARVKMRRPMRI